MGINDLYLSFEEITKRENGKNLDDRLNIDQISRLWSSDPTERERLKRIMLWQFREGRLKGVDISEPASEPSENNDLMTSFMFAIDRQNFRNRFVHLRLDPDYDYLIVEIARNDFLQWLDACQESKPTGRLLALWWGEKPEPDESSANPKTSKKTKAERELTTWLRETWINEGRPEGSEFFAKLKSYENKKGSPIVNHWTTDKKGAGIRWNTGNATGTRAKKTIANMVGRFKNEEAQNPVNSQ